MTNEEAMQILKLKQSNAIPNGLLYEALDLAITSLRSVQGGKNMSNGEWIAFIGLDGRLIAAYTKQGTFPGECQNTIELLCAEHNIKPEEITVTIMKSMKGSEL